MKRNRQKFGLAMTSIGLLASVSGMEVIAQKTPGTRFAGVYDCFNCQVPIPQADYPTFLRLEAIRQDFQNRFGYDKRLVAGDSLMLCAAEFCATYVITLDGNGYYGKTRDMMLPVRDPRDFRQEPGWNRGRFGVGGGGGWGGMGTPRGSVTVGQPTPTAKP